MSEKTTLTEWRNELGYTVEQLADKLGVSVNDVEMWERDEASCPYQRMLELAMDSIACLAHFEKKEANPEDDYAVITATGKKLTHDELIALAEEQIDRTERYLAGAA